MRVYKFEKTITVSSGSGSANTLDVIGGLAYKILVLADTVTTRFKVNITDDDNDVVRAYNFKKGRLDDEKPLSMVGIYTVNITDSDTDEDFTVKIWVTE